MIATILHVGWLNLKRDYVALGLTFILPIVFFAIFAMIFGGMGTGGGEGSGPSSMRIAVADLDGTAISRRFVEALDGQEALEVHASPAATEEEPAPPPFDRETARRAVRLGRYPAAVVLPPGFGASFGAFDGTGDAVELIHDPANPLAQHTVAGLLQASAMMAAPDVLMEKGLEQLETFGGALTPEQRAAVDAFLPVLRGDAGEAGGADGTGGDGAAAAGDDGAAAGDDGAAAGDDGAAAGDDGAAAGDDGAAAGDDGAAAGDDGAAAGDDGAAAGDDGAAAGDDGAAAGDAGPAFSGLVDVKAVSARDVEPAADGDGAAEARPNSIVAYYAAGIGVMFLLFSMSGAAGSLLEEEESGTLERLLGSNVGMGTLLAGRWLFFGLIGFVQMAVMFGFGEAVYGLGLLSAKHLASFVVMTVVTAASAAAFGLLLATVCRSRAQLGGISTVVILVMSALGGSMVPRFVMPEFMNTTALFTFNGWALDGYLKIFWYDDPAAGLPQALAALLPQLAVLAGLTVLFLAVARLLARRWETS